MPNRCSAYKDVCVSRDTLDTILEKKCRSGGDYLLDLVGDNYTT